jgi:hypothetical protein
MRIHIESRFVTNDVDVFLFDRFGGKSFIYRWHGESWEREEYDEAGRELAPSLTLPRDALEELVRAAEGHVHAQDATVRHLDDATATRDRLLTMVEKRGIR